MDNLLNELKVLNEILNFKVKEIPSDTRFWMIRTKKGYFYNEFIGQKFVALAWNLITEETDFSESAEENLRDSILLEYPKIKRPKTVINKCKSFIEDVKVNDILVIPSQGSHYITFALAGEYFEDTSKSVELENKVIFRIEHKDVAINEVSCPYRKRRHITPIRTVKSEEINYNLYRAISNYHGISNFDNYSRYILSIMYNSYAFRNDLNIVYYVRQQGAIGPRHLSGLLYSTTEFLCKMNVNENKISTQINLNSPGPIDFSVLDTFNFLKNNYLPILGMMVVVGGGSFLTFKLPGIPQIIKDVFSIPTSIKKEKLETEKLELEVQQKKIELYDKIKSSGINPGDLNRLIEEIQNHADALNIQPVETIDVTDQAIAATLQGDESDDE